MQLCLGDFILTIGAFLTCDLSFLLGIGAFCLELPLGSRYAKAPQRTVSKQSSTVNRESPTVHEVNSPPPRRKTLQSAGHIGITSAVICAWHTFACRCGCLCSFLTRYAFACRCGRLCSFLTKDSPRHAWIYPKLEVSKNRKRKVLNESN